MKCQILVERLVGRRLHEAQEGQDSVTFSGVFEPLTYKERM